MPSKARLNVPVSITCSAISIAMLIGMAKPIPVFSPRIMIRGLNTGIGFAIPINMAMEIAEQVIETGTFRRALLGIGIETLTDNYELNNIVSAVSKGVIVSSINADSAAGESHLKPADIIIAVGGKPVASAQQLKNQVRSKSIGKALILE